MARAADLDNVEAVESFAANVRALATFDGLFDALSEKGLLRGVDARLRLMALLARLGSAGLGADTRDQLRPFLVAALAKSSAEQAEIDSVFKAWLPDPVDEAVPEQPSTPISVQISNETHVDERASHWMRILLLLGVAVVAAIVGWFTYNGVSLPVTIEGPATPPLVPIPTGWNLSDEIAAALESGLSRVLFALPVLLLGFGFQAWRRDTAAQLSREIGGANLLEKFSVEVETPAWFHTSAARVALESLKRFRSFETKRIDARRTIARTVHAGGRPVVVNQRRRERPQYALFVDIRGRDDHAAYFAGIIEDALCGADIVYTRYDFYGRPNRLYRMRGRGTAAMPDAAPLPLSVVAASHAGERLIMLGTGRSLFEEPRIREEADGSFTRVPEGVPLPELLHLREFAVNILLTPTPRDAWGAHERHLVSAGLDMFTADRTGVQEIGQRLMREADESPLLPDIEEGFGEDAILERLDREALRYASNVPPPQPEIDRLVRDLRIWCWDTDTHTLLVTIGIFPKIEPGFTLLIAERILGEGKLTAERYGRLLRLPWIRDGRMPDWLRIALFNKLNDKEKERVFAARDDVLAKLEAAAKDPAKAQGRFKATLEIARRDDRDPKASRSPMDSGERLPLEERIFLSWKSGGKPLDPVMDVLRPEAPAIVRARWRAEQRRWRLRWSLGVIALALLAALAQPYVTAAWQPVAEPIGVWLSARFGNDVVSNIARFVGDTFSLVAFLGWFGHAFRSREAGKVLQEPQELGLTTATWLRTHAMVGILAYALALLTLLPGHADRAVVLQVGLLAAAGCAAWVWLVTPALWWRTPSADDVLPQRLAQDDWIASTIGTTATACIAFAAAYALYRLPSTSIAAGKIWILLGLAVGVGIALALALQLARVWLLSAASENSPGRPWLDAAFATTGSLIILSALARLRSFVPDDILMIFVFVTFAVLVVVGIFGTFGIKKTVPLGRSLLVAILAPFSIAGSLVTSELNWLFALVATFSFFAFSTIAGTSMLFRAIGPYSFRPYFRAPILFLVMLVVGLALITNLNGIPKWQQIGLFSVYQALFFWPIFRFLGPAAIIREEELRRQGISGEPWWKGLDSPWWAVPAMWAVTLRIWPTLSALDISAFALPLAVGFAWRYGHRAYVPIFVGALPFLAVLNTFGEAATPGGVWPVLAILFWAHFTADADFRIRVLRREILSWLDVAVLVAALSIQTAPSGLLPLASFPLWQLTSLTVTLDPTWMIATVGIAVGFSRMPRLKFAVGLVIGAAASFLNLNASTPFLGPPFGILFGISMAQFFTGLLGMFSPSVILWVGRKRLIQRHYWDWGLPAFVGSIATILGSFVLMRLLRVVGSPMSLALVPSLVLSFFVGMAIWRRFPLGRALANFAIASGMAWSLMETFPYTDSLSINLLLFGAFGFVVREVAAPAEGEEDKASVKAQLKATQPGAAAGEMSSPSTATAAVDAVRAAKNLVSVSEARVKTGDEREEDQVAPQQWAAKELSSSKPVRKKRAPR